MKKIGIIIKLIVISAIIFLTMFIGVSLKL